MVTRHRCEPGYWCPGSSRPCVRQSQPWVTGITAPTATGRKCLPFLLVLQPRVECHCGSGSPVQAGSLSCMKLWSQTAPSASICPDAILKTCGMRRGINKKVHFYTADAFSPAALRNVCVCVCVFLTFLFFNWIFYLWAEANSA